MTRHVEVDGLRELSRSLRAVDAELPRELRAALLEAAKPVADQSKRDTPVSRRRKRRHLRDTVRAVATQRGAGVRVGGAANPYPWVALPAITRALRLRQEEVIARTEAAIGRLIDKHF